MGRRRTGRSLRGRLRRLAGERGQTASEYLGVLLVVALIISVVAQSGIASQIRDAVREQICRVAGDGPCPAGPQAEGRGAEPGDDAADRRADAPQAPRPDAGSARVAALSTGVPVETRPAVTTGPAAIGPAGTEPMDGASPEDGDELSEDELRGALWQEALGYARENCSIDECGVEGHSNTALAYYNLLGEETGAFEPTWPEGQNPQAIEGAGEDLLFFIPTGAIARALGVGGKGALGLRAASAVSVRSAYVTARASLRGGRGAWKLPPVARGVTLEKKAGQNLPSNYPVIDRYVRQEEAITNIKSIDLLGRSARSTGALASRLRREVDKTARFKLRPWKGAPRGLASAPVSSRELKVVVEPGAQSRAQRRLFGRLADEADRKGVKLTVETLR